MKTRNLALIASVLAVAAAACGGDDTNPAPVATGTPTNPTDLEGRTLVATSVTEDGADRPLVEGTELVISFEEPGSMSVSAGCNSMFGSYTLEDGTLTAAALASTMMACEEERMEQDDWIGLLLREGVEVTIDGDTVTFTGGSTVITLADREAVSPGVLTGTSWALTDLITMSGSTVSAVPGGVVATLTFNEDGTYQVDTGCNIGNGSAAIENTTIDFGPMALTRRACTSDDAQQVETAMVTVIDGVVDYQLVEGFLRLLNGENGLGFTGS